MRSRQWISITPLIVILALFIFTPILDATATGNTQTIEATVGAVVCHLNPPVFPSDSWETNSRFCHMNNCKYWPGSNTHTFEFPAGVQVSIVLVTTYANTYCSYIYEFVVPDAPTCTTIHGEITCVVPPSGQLSMTVRAIGEVRYTLTVTEIEPLVPPPSDPPIIEPPNPEIVAGVQRVNESSAIPYVVYVPTGERVADENTQFIDIWRLDANGVGQPLLYISREEIWALPPMPAENLLIATSPDAIVSVYKLTTGEFQVNIGPLDDGKLYTTIFDTIPPITVTHSTSVMQ